MIIEFLDLDLFRKETTTFCDTVEQEVIIMPYEAIVWQEIAWDAPSSASASASASASKR